MGNLSSHFEDVLNRGVRGILLSILGGVLLCWNDRWGAA